ncbi:MAG: alpha/beta fold hydrolase [Pseudomonadota bacterium]|nr:alpha/beta fold hydrolase [Pseudomonadota bacterium]MEC8102453.1 alpha/beta fold hydrolase [Pseudomonadota bacterium]MEC8523446.1 alpha/beta fold hydrolase [Pseudomonadota bacterium]
MTILGHPNSPWEKISGQNKPGTPVWLWLPGWGFSGHIFSDLFDALDGEHWIADYRSVDSKFVDISQHLLTTAPLAESRIWVGWSLGGALAMRAVTRNTESPPSSAQDRVITLATGDRFIRPDATSTEGTPLQGMPKDDFSAFREALIQSPKTGMKRFTGLCAKGAEDPRQLMRDLSSTLYAADNSVIQTLNWLEYEALTANQSEHKLHTQAVDALHIYGTHDALNPIKMTPALCSPGKSHCFFLETAGRQHLLDTLQSVATDIPSASILSGGADAKS